MFQAKYVALGKNVCHIHYKQFTKMQMEFELKATSGSSECAFYDGLMKLT